MVRLARTLCSSRTLPGHGCAARAATVSRARVARAAGRSRDVLPAVVGQPGDVRPALAQRRGGKPDDVEAIEQVRGGTTGRRLGVERPVRGGDDPQVEPLSAVLAES